MSSNSRTSLSLEIVRRPRLGQALLLVALCTVALSRLASAQQDLSRVDSIVSEMLADQGIPGASLYVGKLNGRPLMTRAYGFTAMGGTERVTPSSVFPIMSVTKPYTAAMVMQLARTGRIKLDDRIGQYLPGLPPWRDSVTIRQLLTHTGGVVSVDNLPGWRSWKYSVHTNAANLARIANLPLDFPPGSKYAYSNSGYMILGALIERLEGRPYADVLRTRVLAPLGLRETTPCYAAAAAGQLGSGHPVLGESVVVKPLTAFMRADSVLGPHGLCATAADVGRFMAALMSGRVTGAEGLAEMRLVPAGALADGAGAGLYRGAEGKRPIWHHSGGSMTEGTSSDAAVYPEDSLVVVVLLNADNSATELTRRVARAVLRIPEREVPDLPLDSTARSRYVGVYRFGGGRTRISERNGRLFGIGQRLRYQGNDTFVPDIERDLRIVFKREPDGRVERGEVLRESRLVAPLQRQP
jgi:CubicO group peptidase (beta-lactamase class C family)